MTIRLKLVLLQVMFAMLVAGISGGHIYEHLSEAEEDAVRNAESTNQAFAVSLAFVDKTTDIPPIYKSPSGLRDFISDRKKRLHGVEDFVVVDGNKKILGDVISENVGRIFDHDKNDEVGQTIRDGITRIFIERSTDYPDGIRQLVVPLKTEEGETVGAVIMEYTAYHNKYIALIKKEVRNILIFSALIIFISLGIGYLLAGGIARNIARLKKATEAVAAGSLDVKVEVESKDELGDLAAAFNSMAALRKAAEEGMRESEETLKAILNATTDAMFLIDTVGNILTLNETTALRLGKTKDELIGTCIYDHLPPDIARSRRAYVNEAISSGKTVNFEDERNGEWVDNSIYPIFNEQEKIVKVAIYGRYITDRKKAEEAVKESEERYSDLFENVNDLVQCVTADGLYVYVNAAWRRTLGYSEEDVKKLTIMDVIHHDSMAHCMKIFQRLMAGEEVGTCVAVFKSKDGRAITVEGNINCKFENGKPVYTRGIFRDITERKKAEEALRESNARFHSLAEAAGDLFFTINADGEVVYANEMAARVLHAAPEQVVGKRLSDLFPPEDFERLWHFLQKVFEAGEPLYVEAPNHFPEGEVWQGTWLTPLRDMSGNIVTVMGASRDITERKKAEAALRSVHEELLKKSERLEAFQQVAVNREMRMVEMKDEVNGLLERLGEPRKYAEIDGIRIR